MNQIVPRQTVEQVCSFRDAAIAKYAEAFEKIAEAGTYVNTGILSLRKDGKPDKWRPTWPEL